MNWAFKQERKFSPIMTFSYLDSGFVAQSRLFLRGGAGKFSDEDKLTVYPHLLVLKFGSFLWEN